MPKVVEKDEPKSEWAFDGPPIDRSSIADLLKDGTWHRISPRTSTRTLCRKVIKDTWSRNIPHKGYEGPAKERRCTKCEERAKT